MIDERIAEQRVEVAGCVEHVTAPGERRAIAADNGMLLDQEDAKPGPGQEVGTDQAANSRADHDGVIGGRRARAEPMRRERAPHACTVTLLVESPPASRCSVLPAGSARMSRALRPSRRWRSRPPSKVRQPAQWRRRSRQTGLNSAAPADSRASANIPGWFQVGCLRPRCRPSARAG